MPDASLPFLENFYTGVTLYMPAEPVLAQLEVESPKPAEESVTVYLAAAPAKPPELLVTPKTDSLIAATATLPSQTSVPSTRPETGAMAEPGNAASHPATPALQTPFSTLGDKREGVVLLVRLPHEQFLKLPRNVFLNKMLQALGLVMADVVLVNVESHLVVTLAGLRRELAATRIIAFGRDLLDVALRTTQIYEPVQFPGMNLAYLASATVDSVEYDVSLKKRLWPGLQRMFLLRK